MPLTTRQYAGYGLGDLGFNLMFQLSQLLMLKYFTDVQLLNPAHASLIFLGVRVWDGAITPVIGHLASRTRSRLGRYRAWLMWGSLPLALSLVLLFGGPVLAAPYNLLYALLGYLLFGTLFQVANIPYGALTAVLSQDYAERSRLTGWRMSLGIAGGLIATSAAPLLVSAYAEAPETGYRVMAILFASVSLLFLLLSAFSVQEPDPVTAAPESALAGLRMLSQNRPFILLTLTFALNMAALSMITSTVPYFFDHYLDREAQLPFAMLAVFGAAALSVPLWVKVADKSSKKTVYLAGGLMYCAALLAIWALPPEQSLGFFPLYMLQGIAAGSSAFAGWAMLPDTVEYGAWKSGTRAEGAVYGVYNFFFQAGIGAGLALGALGLSLSGYQAGVTQSAQTIAGLRILPTLAPAALIFFSMLALAGYRLSPGLHREIRRELKDREINF